MKDLTERQREFRDFIADYIEENSYPPTVREMAEHFDVSLRAVQDHVSALQKKGFISVNPKLSRSMKVLRDERKQEPPFTAKVPMLGTVAAGIPILSEENLDGYVTVTEPFVKPGKEYFALHVRGSSMINAGILEGDVAVIEQSATALDGQIVVAVVDEAITLKRFYKEASRVRLQPENPAFQPIYCTNVRIVGVLAGILRQY